MANQPNTKIYDEMLRKARQRLQRQQLAVKQTEDEIKQLESDIQRVLTGK